MSATTMQRHEFPDGAALAPAFAQWTANLLQKGVDERGEAVLIVSGGNYAEALLRRAGAAPDRLGARDDHAGRRALRGGRQSALERAAAARESAARPCERRRALRRSPIPGCRRIRNWRRRDARIADLPLPADLVVLGMGDDGHTASWFPGADNLAEAIDPGARNLVLPMRAPGAPEPRLTLTARVILRARALALHIEGADKLATLARAAAEGPVEAMPIRAALRGASDRLTIFSASS